MEWDAQGKPYAKWAEEVTTEYGNLSALDLPAVNWPEDDSQTGGPNVSLGEVDFKASKVRPLQGPECIRTEVTLWSDHGEHAHQAADGTWELCGEQADAGEPVLC